VKRIAAAAWRRKHLKTALRVGNALEGEKINDKCEAPAHEPSVKRSSDSTSPGCWITLEPIATSLPASIAASSLVFRPKGLPIGIHKKNDSALRVEYPHANGRSFAQVRTGQNPNPGVAFLKKAPQGQGFVVAAVIRNDDLEIEFSIRAPMQRGEHRSGQPSLFVVRRK